MLIWIDAVFVAKHKQKSVILLSPEFSQLKIESSVLFKTRIILNGGSEGRTTEIGNYSKIIYILNKAIRKILQTITDQITEFDWHKFGCYQLTVDDSRLRRMIHFSTFLDYFFFLFSVQKFPIQ